MLKRIVLTTLAAGIVSAAGLAQADDETIDETIKVGMSGGYFPFTFVEQDKLQGFEVDVMEAVAEEMGVEVEFITANFSGLFGMLESGRIDTIANQITITEERAAKYAFTEPYVYDGAQVVVKEGNDTIQSIEDLKGKTVAVNLGSNYEALLRELPYADEIDIRTYESNIEQDTALGRVDAFVMDRVSASQVIKEKPMPLALAGKPFSQIRNALPFRDTDEDRALRDRVDEALTTLRESGELRTISEAWFATDITSP
ncbi:amino acid ABC transporter substrate-binding protein [Halomonas sp. KAO]|uniref:amino acid ABC transporter substrate-binding protein n=1 Tax=Halomonas sp. KAO TaxID=2783858 RepID=UPI0018A05714|nr:amino acid ABC transporter substrate-binding protein [Halomonas sp. KAO]MBF7053136.1 amino acid ABC transporter substrate-binding protein [Halomonas sp. KAO]